MEEYKDSRFDDSKRQQDFVEAYKVIYLSEFLSGKQKEPLAYKTDYQLFVLRHWTSFYNQMRKSNINLEVLLTRLVQDIMIKEIQNHIRTLPITDAKPINNFILGTTDEPLITLSTPKDTGITLINTNQLIEDEFMRYFIIKDIYHELDLRYRNIEFNTRAFNGYNGYIAIKNHILQIFRPEIAEKNKNYSAIEQNAIVSETLGILKAISNHSGPPIDLLDTQKIELKREMISDLENKSPDIAFGYYRVANTDGKDYKVAKETELVDAIIKEKANEIQGTPIAQVLQFEYREDGTPKTLEEIIQDQEQELANPEAKPNPPVGPAKQVERIKLRMQIMMQRATQCNRQIDCYNLIRDFIQRYYEILKDDELLGQKLPENPVLYCKTTNMAKKMVYYNEETEAGIEKARFCIGIEDMIESMSRNPNTKEKYTELLEKTIHSSEYREFARRRVEADLKAMYELYRDVSKGVSPFDQAQFDKFSYSNREDIKIYEEQQPE